MLEGDPMRERIRRRLQLLSLLSATVCLALFVAAVALTVPPRASAEPAWGSQLGGLVWAFSMLGFAVVGALIVRAQPSNRMGWLALAISFAVELDAFAGSYRDFTFLGQHALPGAMAMAWLAEWAWVISLGSTGIYFLLLFPNGHLPTPRWRVIGWLGGVGMAVAFIVTGFLPGELSSAPYLTNPLGIEGIEPVLRVLAGGIVLLPVSLVGAGTSLVVRFRRSTGELRLQLRWLATAAAIVGLAYAIALAATLAWSATAGSAADLPFWLRSIEDLANLVLITIPVAAGVAILRYRLYDIDVIINRTVVYGSVTVLLATAIGVANVVLQRVLEAVTGGRSESLTVVLIGGAVLAFAPLRARMRTFADRILPARALLTLLFIDIVGSTPMAVELGDERWHAVLGRYRATVRRELTRFGGHEVDTAGDGFFATFQRPAAGLGGAWAIRSAVEDLGLQIRTGVHMGECVVRGEKLSGVAVHIAARVMAAAGGGEILLTDAVREAVPDLDGRLTDHGRHRLKGVPGDWRLLRLTSAPPAKPV
jgi:class 3 adenylate cyclase